MTLSINIIENTSGFESLEDSWNVVLKNSGCTRSIFQTFDWNLSWWANYKKAKELFILVVKEDNVPIGLAPLYTETRLILGFVPLKKLSIIGTGPSDYLDFIIMKGKERLVHSIMFNYLRNNRNSWDVIDFQEIPSLSPTISYYSRLVSKDHINSKIKFQNFCPVLRLPDRWEDYTNSLSRKSRKNLKRDMRILKKDFDVRFDIVDKPDEINKKITEVIDLHQQKWSSEGKHGSFTSHLFRAFHLEVCKVLSRLRHVRLYMLMLNNELVSALYNYHYDGKIYYYLPGYNKKFSKYSVGRVIIGLAIKDSIKKGVESFDFLRGDENYKYRFGAKSNENYQINLFSGSTKIKIFQPLSRRLNEFVYVNFS